MVEAHQYPALRHLFGAYLNRDWPDEYGTVEHALDSYRNETDSSRRSAVAAEVDEILAGAPNDEELARVLDELGCEYYFEPGVEDVAAFLRDLRARISG